MELFGIGIFELILILLIALIFLGPQDTIKIGRNFGRAVRRFFSSPEWRTLLQASKEIRTIPEKFLEETGLDHPEDILPSEKEIRQEAGLDDLERNMSEWKADLSAMKKGAGPDQPQEILPSNPEIRPPVSPLETGVRTVSPLETGVRTVSPLETGVREAGLDDLERDMSEWKADLSAWGSSKVIVPTPQDTPQPPTADPYGATHVSPQPPAAPTPADQDQPAPAAQAQESSSSTSPTSPEQEQK